MFPIETARLVIREFTEQDWETVHIYGQDPEVCRFVDFGPNTVNESKGFVKMALDCQTQNPRKAFELAVVLKESGLHIGGCAIRIRSDRNRDGDMGYTFRGDMWKKGYATEAAAAIVKFGFEELNLHRIWATTAPDNIASQKVLEKIGMKKEGHLRENMFAKGKWRDSIVYAILEQEFKNTSTDE